LPLILGIGAAMIGLDQYTSYLSVRGLAGATAAFGSAVLALIYIIGVVMLVCLGFMVNKEVALSQGSAGGVERAGNGVTPLSVMTNSVLLLRKYMLMSTIGRIMAISGVLMYVSGLMFTNPFLLAFTILFLLGVGSLLSSTAQVLIAVEITPSTRRSAVVSTAAGGDSIIRGSNRVAPAPVVTPVAIVEPALGGKKVGLSLPDAKESKTASSATGVIGVAAKSGRPNWKDRRARDKKAAGNKGGSKVSAAAATTTSSITASTSTTAASSRDPSAGTSTRRGVKNRVAPLP